MLNRITSVAGPLTIVSIFVFIYFLVFPDDMLQLTAPLANLFDVTNSVSPCLYGVIGVLILACTITRVWGSKQKIHD